MLKHCLCSIRKQNEKICMVKILTVMSIATSCIAVLLYRVKILNVELVMIKEKRLGFQNTLNSSVGLLIRPYILLFISLDTDGLYLT